MEKVQTMQHFLRKHLKNAKMPILFIYLILFFFFRYSAVCNPYKFREKNMENMNSSFAKVLLLIISASVAINIPRFLETTIKIREQNDSEKRNNSSSNFPLLDLEDFSYEYELTPLRTDPNYIR